MQLPIGADEVGRVMKHCIAFIASVGVGDRYSRVYGLWGVCIVYNWRCTARSCIEETKEESVVIAELGDWRNTPLQMYL